MPPREAKIEIITNLGALLAIVIIWQSFFYGFVAYFVFDIPIAMAIAPGITILIIGCLFILRKYININFAKVMFLFVVVLNIFIQSIMVGRNYSMHLFLFFLLISPFFTFSYQNKGYIWLVIMMISSLIFLSYLYFDNFKPLYEGFDSIIFYGKYICITLVIVGICFMTYYQWSESNRLEDQLEEEQQKSEELRKIAEEQKEIAEEERQKSDELLLNILPKEVANELKEKGASLPVKYDSVTVLFTDFVGFTQITEKLEAEELIDELDKCFSYFDTVTKRYNLEKIKTIGDSYMLAAGLPEQNNTHYIDCLLAAMEIQAFMNQMKEIKELQSLPYWELRLGINTGSLVAGVIGEMKFAYDIFGDTVNIASRMESSGFPGKINISLSTYNLVKYLFDCEFRGMVMAKRKGDVPMYFVNGIKAKYSVNGEGRVPDDRFKEIYENIKNGAKLRYKKEMASA